MYSMIFFKRMYSYMAIYAEKNVRTCSNVKHHPSRLFQVIFSYFSLDTNFFLQ